MATPKKKPKIQASDVEVNNRTLEAVLVDLAEQAKANDARSARAEERSARAEEQAAVALKNIDLAFQTMAALTKDLLALAKRTDDRLGAVEKAVAAE
jgi:hypothetical protein